MKNVRTANFWQIDNQKPRIKERIGAEILPIKLAFDKYNWVRKQIKQRPNLGYFIWVKKSSDHELMSCMMISSKNQKQRVKNLMIIEPKIKARAFEICETEKCGLGGEHVGQSLIILKKGSSLNLIHSHRWSKSDKVNMRLMIKMEEGASLVKEYKCVKTAEDLDIETEIKAEKKAKINSKTMILAKDSKVNLKEFGNLKGDGAEAIIRLRLVGKENSQIRAESMMKAKGRSAGHVDCMGLVVGDKAKIKVMPGLLNMDKFSSLTHEASVGRISKKKLEYLRSKGLSEYEAINLIIGGFLSK